MPVQQTLITDYTDFVVRVAQAGHISTFAAACRLASAGVPLETALQRLARRSA